MAERKKRNTKAFNTTIPAQTEKKIEQLIEDGHYNSKSAVVVAGVDKLHASKMREQGK